MAHKPTSRLQRWLWALTMFSFASIGGMHSTEHVASRASEPWLQQWVVQFVVPPVAAAQASCPPEPCVPGNAVGRDFFVQVVERLSDVSLSEFAVDALVAWAPWENTLACWNPLATTQQMSVICNFNTARVQSYQDQEMGVAATAITLNLGYYNAIRSMLRLEAFDREALRAALDIWGTCAGPSCDQLLNTWEALWDAATGVCCGCLPASCCASRAIQTSPFPIVFAGDGSAGLCGLAVPACVATGRHYTTSFEFSAGLAGSEPREPSPIDNSFNRYDTPNGVVAPSVFELTEILAQPAEHTRAPVPPRTSTQANRVEPVRTPPTSAGYRLVKSVFGSGGGPKTSARYVMNSTQGQPTDLSRRTSASYVLVPGYWGPWKPVTLEYGVYLPLMVGNR